MRGISMVAQATEDIFLNLKMTGALAKKYHFFFSFSPFGKREIVSSGCVKNGFICSFFPECYTQPDAADYRGRVSVTKFGKPCQVWTSTSPNDASLYPRHYPSSGLGSHNYCRNPDGESTAWCFNANDTTYEACDVGKPSCNPGEWAAKMGFYT